MLATVKTAEVNTWEADMKIQMSVPQLKVRRDAMDLGTKQSIKVCVPVEYYFVTADCGKECLRTVARPGLGGGG